MKVLKWLDQNLEEILLATLLLILSTLIMVNVILRYALGAGIEWSEEVCRYTLVFSCFISIPHWVRRGNGIAVDLAVQLLPKAPQTVLRLVVKVAIVVFFAILLNGALGVFRSVEASGQISGTLTWLEMKWIYTAPVIGFGLAVIRGVQAVILQLAEFKTKKEA